MWWVWFISLPYIIAMLWLLWGMYKLPEITTKNSKANIQFSIVIPFRNEAKNLPKLLHSLQQLQYPTSHYELLFVNDGSEDPSEEIIHQVLSKSQLPYRILQNTPNQTSPKKAAITLAIRKSQYPWIVTTDADCYVPAMWLQVYNDFILDHHPTCIAAPVTYEGGSSFLHGYQQLDNWSLQAVTMGSYGHECPTMANGANFCYLKSAFQTVGGFEGNMNVASGDDVFLMEKFQKKYPSTTTYIKSKEVIVLTQPAETWQELIQQRIRWASKTSKTDNWVTQLLGLLVLFQNTLVVSIPFILLLRIDLWAIILTVLFLKLFVDYLLLWHSARFFGTFVHVLYFLKSSIVYAFISVYTAVRALFGPYTWKGRNYKKGA